MNRPITKILLQLRVVTLHDVTSQIPSVCCGNQLEVIITDHAVTLQGFERKIALLYAYTSGSNMGETPATRMLVWQGNIQGIMSRNVFALNGSSWVISGFSVSCYWPMCVSCREGCMGDTPVGAEIPQRGSTQLPVCRYARIHGRCPSDHGPVDSHRRGQPLPNPRRITMLSSAKHNKPVSN